MKRLITIALALVGALMLVLSCEKAPFVTMTGPRSFTFTRDGGTQSFAFTCNRDWNVSSSESWIRVSPSSGAKSDNEFTVTITCSANTTYDSRNATITVRVEELTETISVTQGTGLGLLVSPTTFDLTNAAQDIEIEVQKNVQYAVTIDEACKDWISQKGTKALSSEKVTFAIAKNETYDNREGKITFKQTDGDLVQTVTVKQSQTNGLFITTPEYDLSNEDHTLSVEVKANVQFEVTSKADWIKYVETKALAPSTVVLSIEANESYDNRTGTVVVKQTNGDLTGTITIRQKQTDYLSVTPTSFDLTNKGQSVNIEIKDNVSYSVVIPDDAKSWISIQSNTQTKALADDKVVLSIAANTTYDEREASVTIKQVDGPLAETVKIKQAFLEGLFISDTEFEVSEEAQSISIDVQSNVEYSVSTDAKWIEYVSTKGLQTTTIVLNIKASDEFDKRVGQVVVSQVGGDLSSIVTITQKEAKPIEVTLQSAGSLKSILGEDYKSIIGLKLSGEINGSDILLIRRMEELKYLDLTNTRIVSGGASYYTDQYSKQYYTEDDVIGVYAFAYLPIKKFFLPKVISKISERAFYQSKLESISPIPGNAVLSEEVFMYCSSLKSIVIEDGITVIPVYCFGKCSALETITLPSTLIEIGSAALDGTSLSSITFPSSLKKIGSGAVSSTTATFTSIVIPKNVEYIGDWAFEMCKDLKEIHIQAMPATLTYIGKTIANHDNVTVYIPKGTYDDFFLTEIGNFKNIIEE